MNYIQQLEIQSERDKFIDILGEQQANAFISVALGVLSKNKKMLKAESRTVVNALLNVASLGLKLEPQFGHCHIDTYDSVGSKGKLTYAQFQIGYKGLIEMGLRSERFKTINVTEVRETEYVGTDRLTGEITFNWIESDDERNQKEVIGYVAFFELKDGFRKSLYASKKDVEAHAKKYSKTFSEKESKIGWNDNFDWMACKTVLKNLLSKFAPKTNEILNAIRTDQAVIRDSEAKVLEYVDNPNKSNKVGVETLKKESVNNAITDRIRKFIRNAKTLEVLEQCKEEAFKYEQTKKTYKTKEYKLKRNK